MMNQNNSDVTIKDLKFQRESELRKHFEIFIDLFSPVNHRNISNIGISTVSCGIELEAFFSSEYKITYDRVVNFEGTIDQLSSKELCVENLESKKKEFDRLDSEARCDYEKKLKKTLKEFWSQEIYLGPVDLAIDTLYYKQKCGICRAGVRSCWYCNNGKVKCGKCKGTKKSECFYCYGSGQKKCKNCSGNGQISEMKWIEDPCYGCGERGYINCYSCSGRGTVTDYDYNNNQITSTCNNCCGRGEVQCIGCNGVGRKSAYKKQYENCNSCYGSRYQSCDECYGRGQSSCLNCDEQGSVSCGNCFGTQSLTCDVCYGQQDLIFSGKFSKSFKNDELKILEKDDCSNVGDFVASQLSSLKAEELKGSLNEIGYSVSSAEVNFSESDSKIALAQSLGLTLLKIDINLNGVAPSMYFLNTKKGIIYGMDGFLNFQINESLKKITNSKLEGIIKLKGLGRGLDQVAHEVPFFGKLMNSSDYLNSNVALEEIVESIDPAFSYIDEVIYDSLKSQRDLVVNLAKNNAVVATRNLPSFLVLLAMLSIVYFTFIS